MEGIVEFESDWAILELDSSRLIVKGGFTLGFGPKTSPKRILFLNSRLDPSSKIGFSKSRGTFFLVGTNKIWWKSSATLTALHFFIPWTQILV